MVDAFQPKHLLAATDLSESNIAALRYARLLSERFRTTLTVMYSAPDHGAQWRGEVEAHVGPILRGVPYEIFVAA